MSYATDCWQLEGRSRSARCGTLPPTEPRGTTTQTKGDPLDYPNPRGEAEARLNSHMTLEIRTAAGPASTVQWVFNGGPYIGGAEGEQRVQCQVVCPPP